MISKRQYQRTLNACYHLFCLDWCLANLSRATIENTIIEYFNKQDDYEDSYTLLDYVRDEGFDGKFVESKNEFETDEFRDGTYMLRLLGEHPDLMESWLDCRRDPPEDSFFD